ncbi:methyltransferase family protein [Mangrovicella endophytica]|uniref:methyltransferase family protein n=1 Tax=Mangrovicella endophytica TaxID=2066697 RepID=UPI000C9E0820|nr:isoprenylcysteine carboxylmethyltransferase family protein [Mangrovicella endophytica]
MALHRYQRLRRFVLAAVLAAALLILLFVRSSWEDDLIHELIEAVGLGLIAIAIIGRMWCTLYIGGRKAAEVVDSGPYSITRNPLYVFSSIGAAGLGAQTGSITIAVVAMLGCVAAFQIVIRREERFLRGEFGPAYEAYLARVPRFIPNPALFRDEKELSIRTRRIYSTLADGLVFFVSMPLLEGVEWLQDSGLVPVLLRLP